MTTSISRRTVLGAGLATAAGLTGCSRFGGGPTSAEGGGTSIEMVWKGDAERAEITRAALDLFSSKHPDITVTTDYQSGDEYAQKLSIRFASGNPPDVMRMNRESLRDYGDRGVLFDLGQSVTTDQIQQTALEAGRVEGALLGVTGGLTSLAILLDTELYAEHGVDVPDMDTWSWDDFAAAAAEVTRASGEKVYGGELPVGDALNLGIWLRQRGEDLWTPDGGVAFSEEAITEWFQTWVRLRDQGAIPPGGAIDDLGASADQSPLARGVIASQALPPNSFGAFSKASGGTLVMGNFPGETQATRRGQQLIPGMYWSVSASSRSSEQAALLVDFLVNDVEANKLTGATNGVPANPQVAEAIAPSLSPDDQTAFEYIIALGQHELVAPIPDPLGTGDFTNALSQIADTVKFDKATPAEAASELMTAARTALEPSA